MKKVARRILQLKLRWLARWTVARHKPLVVAISGTTRKTATKDRIYDMLHEKYHVRRNQRSYNTEFGVPVAVLGVDPGGSSYFKWWAALWAGLRPLLSAKYPKILVLEFGVDSRGDIENLLRIVRPKIAVFTTIEPWSQEGAADETAIMAEEERRLMESLPRDGVAVINQDDAHLKDISLHAKAKVVPYRGAGDAESYVKAAANVAVQEIERLVKKK